MFEEPESVTECSLKPNYNRLYDEHIHRVVRSYEGCKFYFMVFKPYDKPYLEDKEWYYSRALDAVYNKLKNYCPLLIVTREYDAAKCHINALCVSSADLEAKFHDKSSHNKFKMYASKSTDRIQAFIYMFKEAQKRYFVKYQDYIIYDLVPKPKFPRVKQLNALLSTIDETKDI